MKKFASITIAMLMVVSMMLSSIVSTSARTNGTGIDGAQKGTIKLYKYESNSNKSKPVDGATFVAYKVMSLTADAEGDATFTVDSDLSNVITADDLVHTGKTNAAGDLYKSTKELEAKISDIEALKDKLEATTFTGTGKETGEYIASDLGLGIYLVVETVVPDGYIKDTQSFLVSVPEWVNGNDGTVGYWNYTITAYPKDKTINLDKSIKDPDKNNALVNEAVYEIGQTIDYVVEAEVPNYGEVLTMPGTRLTAYLQNHEKESERKKFEALYLEFTDEFSSGLTFLGADSVTFTSGEHVFEQGVDYTVTVKDNSFVARFDDWSKLMDFEGEKIVLTYQAVLNENAKIESENENEVEFEYINNPDSGEKKVLTDPAYVYAFQMNINKTFEGKSAANAGVDATKVTFKLYRNADKTNAVKVVKLADGEYALYDTKTTKTPQNTVNLAADGTLKVKGLEEGTYFLEEVETASGYAIPTTMIEVKLGENNIAKTGYTHIGVTPTHCTNDGTEAPLKLVSGMTNTFNVDVNNVIKQFTLPTTGGDGLLIFTIAGGILMAAAIILFTTLRKKSTSK